MINIYKFIIKFKFFNNILIHKLSILYINLFKIKNLNKNVNLKIIIFNA